jgi:DNA-binding MarR family transcriptional regulator
MDGFDAFSLDETIHVRARLGIMAFLVGAQKADFNTLKAHLEITDGNLSLHLKKLEEAGYVALRRTLEGKRTRTVVTLTDEGREAFEAYLGAIARLVSPRS